MISMVILESGKKIKKMAEDRTSIQMARDMREVGSKTKNKEKVYIDIEMEMFTRVDGKMIEDKDKDPWTIIMDLNISEIALKESSRAEESFYFPMEISTKVNGNQVKCMEMVSS